MENLNDMKTLNWIGVIALGALALGCDKNSGGTTGDRYNSSGSDASASRQTEPVDRYSNTNSALAVPADNTGRNVRDRSDATLTPEDQGSSEADRELTRKIRRAITESDQLSATAKNIKIVSVNGKVTLRGPVTTEQERQLVDSIVKQFGVTTTDNQLEVKTINQ